MARAPPDRTRMAARQRRQRIGGKSINSVLWLSFHAGQVMSHAHWPFHRSIVSKGVEQLDGGRHSRNVPIKMWKKINKKKHGVLRARIQGVCQLQRTSLESYWWNSNLHPIIVFSWYKIQNSADTKLAPKLDRLSSLHAIEASVSGSTLTYRRSHPVHCVHVSQSLNYQFLFVNIF